MQVNNKTIVVTGAGSGIGRALSLQLLQKQAKVVGVDLHPDALAETQKMAGIGDERFKAFVLDITDKTNKFSSVSFKYVLLQVLPKYLVQG